MNEKKIIADLQTCIKKLRNIASEHGKNKQTDNSEIIMTELRNGFLDKKWVNRLAIFLKGTGCCYTKKSGGCTFCGFYNASNFNNKIPDSSYLEQFEKAIKQDKEQCPIICLYNDGSLFSEEEISFSVLKKIMVCLENMPSVKKVVLESRVVDFSEEKIIELRNVFSKQLEIAVGFETANSVVRDFCINKSFSNAAFEKSVNFCVQYDVDIIPLMLFKPPFLTEKEAIDDYVSSLKYLDQFNLKRIDMEILTIERDTFAYLLWEKKLFRPPWFWSIIETLKRNSQENFSTPIFIGPLSYSVRAECLPSNCNRCDQLIIERFNDYNLSRMVSVFDDIVCSCRNKWEEEIQKKPKIKSIPLRVASFLKNIEN